METQSVQTFDGSGRPSETPRHGGHLSPAVTDANPLGAEVADEGLKLGWFAELNRDPSKVVVGGLPDLMFGGLLPKRCRGCGLGGERTSIPSRQAPVSGSPRNVASDLKRSDCPLVRGADAIELFHERDSQPLNGIAVEDEFAGGQAGRDVIDPWRPGDQPTRGELPGGSGPGRSRCNPRGRSRSATEADSGNRLKLCRSHPCRLHELLQGVQSRLDVERNRLARNRLQLLPKTIQFSADLPQGTHG